MKIYADEFNTNARVPRVCFPDLSPTELRRWSLAKAYDNCMRAGLGQGPVSDGIEQEVNALSNRLLSRVGGGDPSAFFVPPQILAAEVRKTLATRDLTASVASAGGFTVETEILGVVDALRPMLRLGRLGVPTISGLRANQTVVRQGGTVTITWSTTEATAAAETASLSLGQISMTPKTVSMYIEASYLQMLMASDRTGALVVRELVKSAATAVEQAALAGTGASGQPLGLLNTSGIGTFNGTSITYANVLESQTDVLNANALTDEARLGYITTPSVAQVLANRQGFSTQAPMWEGNLAAGQLVGAPAFSTMNVPLGTLIGGDWSQLLIAEWGVGLEVRVNPFANFQAGIIGLAAFLSMDVAVLKPASFSVATGVS